MAFSFISFRLKKRKIKIFIRMYRPLRGKFLSNNGLGFNEVPMAG